MQVILILNIYWFLDKYGEFTFLTLTIKVENALKADNNINLISLKIDYFVN